RGVTSNLENSLDCEETILEEEVLANETLPLSDEEITLDEAAFEARSNGSGVGVIIMSLFDGRTLNRSWDQEDDLSLLGLLDTFVHRMSGVIRRREKDVKDLDY
nr:hypothetical protein [Tanacetum cinerariifolium]